MNAEPLPFDRLDDNMENNMSDATQEAAPSWFHRLNALNVNEKVEKKNGFSYLSWAWAHARMAELDPDFDWHPETFDGLPYLKMPGGCMVKITVKFQGKEKSHIYPVLDHRNKPIPEPSVFDINTSIMRGFVKCCALFGLGLYIYAGEDLPEDEQKQRVQDELTGYAKRWADVLTQDVDEETMADHVLALHDEINAKGAEFYAAVSELMDSKQRSAWKALIKMARKPREVLANGRAA